MRTMCLLTGLALLALVLPVQANDARDALTHAALKRVERLEAENADLRKRVAALEHAAKSKASACDCESNPCPDARCQAYGGGGDCECTRKSAVTPTTPARSKRLVPVCDGGMCRLIEVDDPANSNRAAPALTTPTVIQEPLSYGSFAPPACSSGSCSGGSCGVPQYRRFAPFGGFFRR